LLDFQRHWPTHEPHTYIDFKRVDSYHCEVDASRPLKRLSECNDEF
jgi:hypothetical protein